MKIIIMITVSIFLQLICNAQIVKIHSSIDDGKYADAEKKHKKLTEKKISNNPVIHFYNDARLKFYHRDTVGAKESLDKAMYYWNQLSPSAKKKVQKTVSENSIKAMYKKLEPKSKSEPKSNPKPIEEPVSIPGIPDSIKVLIDELRAENDDLRIKGYVESQNMLAATLKTQYEIGEKQGLPVPALIKIKTVTYGEYDENIKLTFEYGFDKAKIQGKIVDYELGEYSTPMSKWILIQLQSALIEFVKAKGNEKTIITGTITGFADGWPVTDTLSYNKDFLTIQNVKYFSQDEKQHKTISMDRGELIHTNERLSFLRAYFAYFGLSTVPNVDKNGLIINTKTAVQKGADYRKVEIFIDIKDALAKELDLLGEDLKEFYKNNKEKFKLNK